MNIKTIKKITSDEQVERDALREKKELTEEEASRIVFLEVKEFWNCEC